MQQEENETLAEFVGRIDASAEGAESTDDHEELESAVVEAAPFMPMPATIAQALRSAPSISQAKEDAKIPPQLTISELVGHPIVLIEKRKQNAFLPQDGTTRAGWQVLGAYQEDEKPFTVWIGQTVLMKDLSILNLPFRTTIIKRGRTYLFS